MQLLTCALALVFSALAMAMAAAGLAVAMAWVGAMNSLKAQAEEIVLSELVYA